MPLPKADFDAWLTGPDREGERDAQPGAVRVGRGAGTGGRAGAPRTSTFTTTGPPGAGRHPVHDPLPERRQRRPRTTSRSRTPSGAQVFKGDIVTGPADHGLQRARARRRHVHVRLHGPSEHDRHAHGPVREPAGMATTTLNPAAPAYRSALYEWLTTTDHKKIGIMYLVNSILFFLAGGHPRPGRPRWSWRQPGLQLVSARSSTTRRSRCTPRSCCSCSSSRSWRASGTTPCRSRSAPRTWPSRGSTRCRSGCCRWAAR